MRAMVLLLLGLLAIPAAAGEPKPASVEPSLHTVASTGFHRFLEYRVCSPEHCWSNAFLQWFEREAPERTVVKTVEVSELGYGKGVDSARWTGTGDRLHLEVRVVPSHGGFEPYDLIIEPGPPGRYTASRR